MYYKVVVPCVPKEDPPVEICKRLWKHLKDERACDVSSPHGCEAVYGTLASMEWWFHASTFCDMDKVNRAFMYATKDNAYGAIRCVGH